MKQKAKVIELRPYDEVPSFVTTNAGKVPWSAIGDLEPEIRMPVSAFRNWLAIVFLGSWLGGFVMGSFIGHRSGVRTEQVAEALR